MASRRAFVRSVAVLGLPTLAAGCTDHFDGTSRPNPKTDVNPAGQRGTATRSQSTSTPKNNHPLSVATAGLLVEPITRAAALWNGNSLPTEDKYGGSPADRLNSSGPGFAGYFASRQGFSPTRTPNRPPFRVTVGDNGDQEAYTALTNATVDIAMVRAETYSTVASEMDVSDLVRHDLFRVGKAIVVSDAVYRAGVTSISPGELRGIYNGRLNNWRSLGGPDREIHLIGTVNDAHPETFEQTFLKDEPGGGADDLYGRVRRKVAAVTDRDDVVTRIPVRDVKSLRAGGTDGYRILDIEVDGEPRGPGGAAYPGTYPVPLFTIGQPDPRERAFLEALSATAVQTMILNDADGRTDVIPTATKPEY